MAHNGILIEPIRIFVFVSNRFLLQGSNKEHKNDVTNLFG